MTNSQYDNQERISAMQEIRQIESAPLADRKHAQGTWCYAIEFHHEHISESVEWLFNGSYGRGAQLFAQDRLKLSARANKVAQIAQLVALFEYRCPANFARQAFKRLTPEQQAAVNAAIQSKIDAYERDSQ